MDFAIKYKFSNEYAYLSNISTVRFHMTMLMCNCGIFIVTFSVLAYLTMVIETDLI